MKKVLILCSTNYTLLNAINLQKFFLNNFNGNCIVDLLFIYRTNDPTKTIKKIEKKSFFNTIYVCPYLNKFSLIKKIQFYFFPYIFIQKFSKKKIFIPFQSKYDFVISQSFFLSIMTKKFHKNNKFYLFDEGLSSYTGREINKGRIYNFILNKIIKIKLEGIYLRKLELVCYKFKNLIQIENKFDLSKKNCLEIFGFKKKYSKVLYFSAPSYGVFNLIKNKEKQDKKKFYSLFEKVEKNLLILLKYKNYEIVKHPLLQPQKSFFWEIGYLNHKLTNKNILISFISSACISPKIFFNNEPTIIFLNKLTKAKFFNFDKLILNLNKIYKRKNKIFLPKTVLELENIINKIDK